MTQSPFDNQRDEALGRLLREQLTGPAPEAFLGRLRVAVAGAEQGNDWDLLARWVRPRTMAFAIAAGLLLWLGAWFESSRPAADASLLVASVVSAQPPRTDEIMGALLESR